MIIAAVKKAKQNKQEIKTVPINRFFTFYCSGNSLFEIRLKFRSINCFSALLPSYRIVGKLTKRFKSCYCPFRQVRFSVTTTTGLVLIFNFFLTNTTQNI